MSGDFSLVQANQPTYQIIERIGGGGFGQVFKVLRNNQIVACKQVHTNDPDAALSEYKIMRRVRGAPHIVVVHDEVEWNPRTQTLTFFMDYYEGKDLDSVVHMLRAMG